MSKRPHWNEEDIQALEHVGSYAEMFALAHSILKRIPGPVAQVCGPISTGGKNSIPENLANLKKAIDHLTEKGHNIFDQTPFEGPIVRMKILPHEDQYPYALLDDFYLPIFKTGVVKKLFFLPGWEKSTGAKWEYEQGKQLNIEIEHLPTDWENASSLQ